MSDCNCKCCHDHGAILKAHAGVEDVVRDTAEEAMRHAGTMPNMPKWKPILPTDVPTNQYEIADGPVRIAVRRWRDGEYSASMSVYMRLDATNESEALNDAPDVLLPYVERALTLLRQMAVPVPAYQSPVGEMAGNPSLNDQNEHHTRKL